MCGRYGLFSDADDAEIRSIIQTVEDRIKTGEVYPTNVAPVLIADLQPTVMTWGFPHFKGSGTIINARSESVLDKRMFRDSVLTRRCIIPSTGFYEWREETVAPMETEDGQLSLTAQASKPYKVKYRFNLPGAGALYMAGFYNRFKGSEGREGREEERFVILTTDANEWMRPFHHRMPVVLRPDEREAWLRAEDFEPIFDRSGVELRHERAG